MGGALSVEMVAIRSPAEVGQERHFWNETL
jgi:hypothetical protein